MTSPANPMGAEAATPAHGHYVYLRTCVCGVAEHEHATAPCPAFRYSRTKIVWVDGADGRSPADDYRPGVNNGD